MDTVFFTHSYFFFFIHTFLNSAYELLYSMCLSESSIESSSRLSCAKVKKCACLDYIQAASTGEAFSGFYCWQFKKLFFTLGDGRVDLTISEWLIMALCQVPHMPWLDPRGQWPTQALCGSPLAGLGVGLHPSITEGKRHCGAGSQQVVVGWVEIESALHWCLQFWFI